MKTIVLKKGLPCSILTVISILILGYVSYAADNKGDLKEPSITSLLNYGNASLGRINVKNEAMNGLGRLPEIDTNFFSSSPAIVAYAAFSGVEANNVLVHIPLTSADATTLYVTFRSNQELPLNVVEWKVSKYDEDLVLKKYDSREINFNDFELDPNFYYFSSWSPNPDEGDKPLIKGLYLCKVTVKANKSTLKSTVKFKFEVTE